MRTLTERLKLTNARTIALIGAGGKTTLLWRLAGEARARGETTLVTTATHILRPAPGQCDRFVSPVDEDELRAALACGGLTCAGYPDANGKCTGLLPALFATGQAAADRVLYEADGAKRLPLKVHRADEPVLHPATDAVVLVLGLSALGRPVRETVHRWELCGALRERPDAAVTADDIVLLAREAIRAAGLTPVHTRIVLGQADTAPAAQAEAIARSLRADGWRVWALSPGKND